MGIWRRGFIKSGIAAASAGMFGRLAAAAPASTDGSTVLCVAGDTLITRRVKRSGSGPFSAVSQLLRDADVAIASGVMTFAEGSSLTPAPKGIDLNLICPGTGADDLGWMGLDLLSYAGNHALDYGSDGLRATLQNLRRAGISIAGAGDTLVEAANPAYAEGRTGRVALIGCATTFPDSWMAAEARHDTAGRPGVNGIRTDITYRLPPRELEQLAHIGRVLAPGIEPLHDLVPGADGLRNLGAGRREDISFLDREFIGGEPGAVATARGPDMKRLLASVEKARRAAAIVCVMLHEHGTYGPGTFLQNIAHECIDAGADCFFVSGSHIFGAVEIYRGKPIVYGLGNLFFEYDTLSRIPAEVYEAYGFDPQSRDPGNVLHAISERYFYRQPQCWESAIARLRFAGGRFVALEIHPLMLRSGDEIPTQRGTPRIASASEAAGILKRIADTSRPFGTALSIESSIGLAQP